jgi:hypothetical protein
MSTIIQLSDHSRSVLKNSSDWYREKIAPPAGEGFRIINYGEPLLSGDQWFSFMLESWRPVHGGGMVTINHRYRRAIA